MTIHLRWHSCDQIECLQINRSCKPANPAFTMSDILRAPASYGRPKLFAFSVDRLSPLAFRIRSRAGGADRDRTDDLKLAKLALSQLSYGPKTDRVLLQQMVGPERVERSTSRLSGVRSNHLSYEPERGVRRNFGIRKTSSGGPTMEAPGRGDARMFIPMRVSTEGRETKGAASRQNLLEEVFV